MSFFVKEKAFYKRILAIAVPATLQNLINFGVGMVGTVMLGMLGETALSASAFANQPGYIFLTVTFGIANGALVLTAQYWGKKEMEPIRYLIGTALKAAVVLAGALTVAVLVSPRAVMRIFTSDESVIAGGIEYLRVIGFSYLFVGVSNCLTIGLRSIEVVRISIVVSSISFVTSAGAGYLLIFGKLGFPALGITGAAVATLAARVMECVILIFYLLFADKRLCLKCRHIFSVNKGLLADYLRSASPIVASELLLGLGLTAQIMILGRLGSDAVAANSICSVIQQLITVFVYGIANASAVIIGKTIGTGDLPLAHRYAKTLQACYIATGAVCGLTMFLVKDAFLSIYQITEATRLLARQFMTVQSFVVFMLAYSAPSVMGILRGGGDARFIVKLDLSIIWGIAIPFGVIAGFFLHLPMPAVYLCLKIDEPIKGICAFFRLQSTKWMHNVTREEIPDT